MKYFFTAVWAIICIGVLVYGQNYWNEQTAAVKAVKPVPLEEPAADAVDYDKYIRLAENWPEAAKAQFKQRLEEQKPYKILFVGSTALEGDWETLVTKGLTSAYSKEHITSAVYTYDDTSRAFVNENWPQEIATEKADLILLEPFILNDNGVVGINDTLENLSKVIEEVKAVNPETTFILQPSYPLYQARVYPKQVEALRAYADENGLAYLDHWTAWPDPNSPEINNYLQDNGPNEQGYQLWTDYIIDYLVNK